MLLIAGPTEEQMTQLIKDAQANIVFSRNATGIKLKLVNALFLGRHCITNKAAIAGTGLESCCYQAESAAELKQAIRQLKDQPMEQEEINNREKELLLQFNNKRNTETLIRHLY